MHRAWLIVSLTAACAPVIAPSRAPVAAANAGPPAIAAEGDATFAPRPFTAEQIRDAWPKNSISRYRTEEKGKPTVIAETRVREATAADATFETHLTSLDGQPVGTPQITTSTWSELMAHATFPATLTTIEDVVVETPAGSFDAWLYTVRSKDPNDKDLSRYYFAKNKPGAPVLFERTADGETVFKVVLVSVKAR